MDKNRTPNTEPRHERQPEAGHEASLTVARRKDPVVEVYKHDLDLTLLRENLKRTPTERIVNLMALQRLAAEARKNCRRGGSST